MIRAWLRRALRRNNAYHQTFRANGEIHPQAQIVLADLARFCRADRSTMVSIMGRGVDPIASAVAEGRRQVWLRIQSQLNLTPADITRMAGSDNQETDDE